jgi:predicted tellurium resistance membrane protein TerC
MGDKDESVLGKLIFWTVVIIAGAVVLRLVFAAVGIAVFLAFRLLPILIVAWVLYRAWKWMADKPAASE